MLRSDDLTEFLGTMYGDEPTRWDPQLRGARRLRLIVNVLTRIRFVSRDGTLDLNSKEGTTDAPAGLVPWFDAPDRQSSAPPSHSAIGPRWAWSIAPLCSGSTPVACGAVSSRRCASALTLGRSSRSDALPPKGPVRRKMREHLRRPCPSIGVATNHGGSAMTPATHGLQRPRNGTRASDSPRATASSTTSGWTELIYNHITLRVPGPETHLPDQPVRPALQRGDARRTWSRSTWTGTSVRRLATGRSTRPASPSTQRSTPGFPTRTA